MSLGDKVGFHQKKLRTVFFAWFSLFNDYSHLNNNIILFAEPLK